MEGARSSAEERYLDMVGPASLNRTSWLMIFLVVLRGTCARTFGRAVSSAEECFLDMEEVRGSIPLPPTIPF